MALRSGGGVRDEGDHWRLTWYDHNGKRRFKRLSKKDCPSKRAAEEIRAKIAQRALEEQIGLALPADRVTLAEYFDRHYVPGKEQDLRDSTLLKHQERFENHLRRPLGALPLARLTGEAIAEALRRARDGKSGKRLSESMVHQCHKTLSAIVHHAAEFGYFGERARQEKLRDQWVKPWRSPKKPKPKARHHLADMAEVGDVLRVAHEEGGLLLATAVLFGVVAGHRRGEQAALEWGSQVRRDADGGWSVIVFAPKTETDRIARIVGEPAKLVDAYRAEHVRVFGDDGCALVFPVRRTLRRRGELVCRKGDARSKPPVSDPQWARIKREARLPEAFRFHDLRGTYAKLLAEHLMPMEIAAAMGHASFETTRRHYLRATRNPSVERAAQVFADLPVDFLPAAEGGLEP